MRTDGKRTKATRVNITVLNIVEDRWKAVAEVQMLRTDGKRKVDIKD